MSLFSNNPFFVAQNSNIYTGYYNVEGTYDYTININLLPIINDITNLFINASYTQNSINSSNVDITAIFRKITIFSQKWGINFSFILLL